MPNKTKDFYEDQSDKTAVKIEFYGKYIEGYLFKILMTFGSCMIIDLFCGQGRSGKAKGSPLALLDKVNYALSADILARRKPKIDIYFNDGDCDHIEILKKEVREYRLRHELPTNISIYYQSTEYKSIIEQVLAAKRFHDKTPKFFFLDPFKYSLVNTSELKGLLSLDNAEILLFLPTFHAYRFISKEPPKKLADFIVDFTDKGLTDYANFYEFTESIRSGLRTKLGTDFVRPFIIDHGSTKNCLFLISNSLVGMNIFNELIWKTGYKLGVNVSEYKEKQTTGLEQGRLFETEVTEIKEIIFKELEIKKKISNVEIIRLVVINMYRLTDAKKALSALIEEDKVEIKPLNNKLKKGALYITINDKDNLKTEFYIK